MLPESSIWATKVCQAHRKPLHLLTFQPEEGKKVLVPLTNSLYVGGTLSDPDHVIVDVGTGFYVEKVREITAALA